jgi:type IV pilus assembly protein PilM
LIFDMLKEVLKKLKDDPASWKRLLKFELEPTFGLDIGSTSVRLLQLHRNADGFSVTAAAMADITNGSLDDEQAQLNIVKAIRECLLVTGIESRFAVCGLSGPEVAVRDFKFPVLTPQELASAVTLEAGQACPFNISECVVDHQILSSTAEGTSGVLVAATQRLVNDKIRFTAGAGVQTVLMDVDGLALLNCFKQMRNKLQRQTITILNIGSSCATLAILGNDNSVFVRDIQNAGDSIITDIANAKSLSRERISQILRSEGLNSYQLEAQTVQKACQSLVGDVTDTLRFYTAQQKNAYIDKIYVCGGFALVRGLAEFLGSQLPAKVILWNPFDEIACPVVQYRDIVEKAGPAFAVAAGLAMRSV